METLTWLRVCVAGAPDSLLLADDTMCTVNSSVVSASDVRSRVRVDAAVRVSDVEAQSGVRVHVDDRPGRVRK